MCGIAGAWDPSASRVDLRSATERMAATFVHRGPDDGGLWQDESAGIALAHRRLAILDLSSAGHQPMVSVCGRFVITFNGEIYNHSDLRNALVGVHGVPAWRGHSDTETLLTAIAAWGVEATLKRCIGMFAFALWDREAGTLTLARDRLGEKPLYYGWQDSTFLFASELKAIKAHPAFRCEVDRAALTLFLRFNYIPAPYSIYRDIRKLPAGSYLTIRAGRRDGAPVAYWSAREIVEHGTTHPFAGDEEEACQRLDTLLRVAIRGQTVADVPLGAFLSGGVDSSAVAAIMQTQSTRPIKTFTIGFHEAAYNEAENAKAVARHLGTEHTELYVTPAEAMAVIPRLPILYDEPFGDSSHIPTFLIAELARRHVTVALSGDGGDELFGGYNRYFWGERGWKKIGWMPRPLRAMASALLTRLSPQSWDRLYQSLECLVPRKLRVRHPGNMLGKIATALRARGPEDLYLGLVSFWDDPSKLVIGAREPATPVTDAAHWAKVPSPWEHMMYLDLITYLPDDILVKVDRAAMGVSLETRVPFLDHRIVEFAWSLPLSMKIRNSGGKWLLRKMLDLYVPRSLIERPKTGFGIPIDQWLRGPLRDWAESLLAPDRLRSEGFFNVTLVREKWEEHLRGDQNWAHHLWGVLMFQGWLETAVLHRGDRP
jgi:asparagine synthase (glutamine-hydrolysing)